MPEYFDVVDKNDKVVGRALRSECHSNPKLIHRAIFVIVIGKEDKILLQKRSKNKDLYPSTWDISVGGHVDVGESYEFAAKRELKEELGLSQPIKRIGKIMLRQKTETEFDMIFEVKITNQKIKFNKEEIDGVKFFNLDEIKKIDKKILAPKVLDVLEFYLKNR